MVATRSLPELLESNPRFSITHVTKRTTWSETEMRVIQHYLSDLYGIKVPGYLLEENTEIVVDYWDLVGVDFFRFSGARSRLLNQLKKITKLLNV